MPRPVKYRCVESIPRVTLSIEEVEAIRLKDLEGLDQEGSAQRMHVSRATFQRVLDSARRKMARALIQGKAIRMEGGNFEMAIRRFRCLDKGHEWEVPFGIAEGSCPACLSTNIRRIDQTATVESGERG